MEHLPSDPRQRARFVASTTSTQQTVSKGLDRWRKYVYWGMIIVLLVCLTSYGFLSLSLSQNLVKVRDVRSTHVALSVSFARYTVPVRSVANRLKIWMYVRSHLYGVFVYESELVVVRTRTSTISSDQ